MTTPTQRAVIYARYSSHSQRDVSIEQQIRACRQYADRNCISVIHVYEDRALTGTNDKRPGFQQMIRDAKKHEWVYVIVYTLDRFARDRYDSATYKRQLKECGVKVLSAMENISDDPTGVLVESLLEGLAEYYSKELSRKIRRGMEDNASKCMVNGSVPLGYVRGEDGRYAIHEQEAALVREIYRRVRDGEPFVEIIEDLNDRGLRTKKGRVWTQSSFNKLLSNDRYIGVYRYGDVCIPGGVPRILDQSLFDAVQLRLHNKSNPRKTSAPRCRRRENSIYLLTGKLFCGHCKAPMVGISGHGKGEAPYYYYTCKGKRKDHTCDKQNVPREKIEQYIATTLRDTMLTPTAVSALADAAVAYQERQEANSEAAALKSRLAEIKKALRNLMAAIEAGIFTATTRDRLTELEAEQRTISAQLTEIEQEAAARLSREEIVAALELFQHGDVTDPDYQESLFDTFLVAAYVYDDRCRFLFNLGDKKQDIEIPFSIEDINFSNPSTDNPLLHHSRPPFDESQVVVFFHCLTGMHFSDNQE